MSDKIDGIQGLGGSKEARESKGAEYAGSLYGAQGAQGVQAPPELGQSQEIKGIKDKIEISKDSEEAGGANIQALKSSLQPGQGQGYEAGVQPSFAMNSIQGIQAGLDPGMQQAGVFKSPPTP
jgi:hypothetical protein